MVLREVFMCACILAAGFLCVFQNEIGTNALLSVEVPGFVDAEDMFSNGGFETEDGYMLNENGECVYFIIDSLNSTTCEYEVEVKARAYDNSLNLEILVDGFSFGMLEIEPSKDYVTYSKRVTIQNGIHRLEAKLYSGGENGGLEIDGLGISLIYQAETSQIASDQGLECMLDENADNCSYMKLKENGDFLENRIYIPRENLYKFKMRAREIEYGTEHSQAVILIDGIEYGKINVSQEAWSWYYLNLNLTAGEHLLRVLYSNDNLERELHVDAFLLGTYSAEFENIDGEEYLLPGIFEAEMLSHIGGMADLGSWVLKYDNDMVYMRGRSELSSYYQIEVVAYSDGSTKLALDINGEVIMIWKVKGNSTLKQRARLDSGLHTIALRLYSGGALGDISIDKITISYAVQGESCNLSGLAYVRDDITAECGLVALLSKSGDCANSTLFFPYSGSYNISIRAKEDVSGSEHAICRVLIDGLERGNFEVTKNWRWYGIQLDKISYGYHNISFVFLNDHYNNSAKTDRNLRIDVFILSPKKTSTKEDFVISPCKIEG
ncbi:MAG: carbohydrate-binding domain-containing protein, partial [Thermoplasmata archaeon]